VTAAFASAVESAPVPEPGVRLWRLPQAGFVIRGGGRTVAVDPWLSRRLEVDTAGGATPVRRATLIPCRAEDLPRVDLVLCTHEHPDHLDVDTLRVVAERSPEARFVVPAPLTGLLEEATIDPDRVDGVEVEERRTVAGVEVLALPARHMLAADPPNAYDFSRDERGRHRAVGYVLRLGEITVFHSGDTVRAPGDAERLLRERIDVALLPVNGRDWMRERDGLVGNLDGPEAASLAVEAGIPHLVPCHYDGVLGNTGDPAAVVAYAIANVLPLTVHVVGSPGFVVTP
jgi:L-ascorbate metabolism protein UlaG (beta-lactamase superfamily)